MKLWGGRFETGPSEVFEQFSGSLHFDCKLIFADLQGSQAFARALNAHGILTDSRMQSNWSQPSPKSVRKRRRPTIITEGANDEDIHTFVIRKLGEKVGALAGQDPYRTQPQ